MMYFRARDNSSLREGILLHNKSFFNTKKEQRQSDIENS